MPRSFISQRLELNLIGPESDNELLVHYPTDVYLTGILFPQRSPIANEEADQLQAEGTKDTDSNDVSRDEVSLATVKRPASAGISFVVEASEAPAITIQVTGAYYKRDPDYPFETEERGETVVKNKWRRRPVTAVVEGIALDFSSREISLKDRGYDCLHLHIRTAPWDSRLLVTVALVNAEQMEKGYERDRYEECCLFQTRLEILCCSGTQFCPRPLGGTAIDDDTRMSRLIYRDACEYAVGHTCSADWKQSEGRIERVVSEWLPGSVVKSMSPVGAAEFSVLADKEKGPILSTRWLSESDPKKLIEGLSWLPSRYKAWLDGEAAKIEGLSEENKQQARKHVAAAIEIAERMQSGIEKIASDEDVLLAFRLANRAILLQRQWAEGDSSEDLVWYPFQLGFILLCLESLADDEHPDRAVADLLWFPTGGGKTEAYLGLIAFILFLRRLRYGSKGSGVAAFMRYTLRLLTIQQFQRAASLISACEHLRLGHDLPPGIACELDGEPFSIGLWVGGDATPNRYVEAKKALSDSNAHNRPDVLSHCPRHRRSRLRWKASDEKQSVFATCSDPECSWNGEETPLPVFTVDSDLYVRVPSLVIGTVDKFAQLARNPLSGRLFGSGVNVRRPDLIIQDELHLISGPLGTLAGLYEIAIDRLCSEDGRRPKVIASTATIRQAASQINALFDRQTCLFPPPVIDSDDSGFAVEDQTAPGRQYLGLTTAGRSAKFALQAVSASLLQGVSSPAMPNQFRDDFWTLVAYFNSLRELGGALVLMRDDVADSIADYAGRSGENERELTQPLELTSRVSSTEIKEILGDLELVQGQAGCCDVVLASNMISVGVDVPRLGLMVVNGQPKGIAEYIQATSRVGRRFGGPGGVILTIYNNAKARDRSHFETFRTWHEALYREVEATSVTPFAPRAREKAIHAALVILARHLIDSLNNNPSRASDVKSELSGFLDEIHERAKRIDNEEASDARDLLEDFLVDWVNNAPDLNAYWNDRAYRHSLLISAETVAQKRARYGSFRSRAKATPNSMRNVEASTLFKLKEPLG